MLFSEIYTPASQQPQMSEEQMRQARINRWGTDAVGPRDAFSEDYSDKFNTVLSPDEEEKYQAWATENHREKDVYDYDLRGAWRELQSGTMSEDERGHLGDKYKKPNHPTFSDQSIYSGQDGVAGGVWSRNAEGTDVYTPGRKLSSVEADRLRRYFLRNEPGVMLDLKDKVFEERPLPGVNMPLGVFSGLGDTWKGIPAAVLQTASSAITAFKNTGADVLSRMGRDETRAWWEGQKAVMDQAARDIRDYNKVHFEVDPETMGTASQIVYGLFKTLPKAIGYGLAGGVAGGALAFGADVGIDETNRLMDEGVDRDTAINAGLVSFGMNAIGMRLPAVLGASRGMSMAYGAAANAGTNVAEVEGIKFILEHQDYNQLAQQYDLNGVDLAVSAVMGAAFGGAFWRSPEQIRTQKYQDAARLVYEDQRTALFNKGQSQFNFEQAGTQAAINSLAVVALAKRLGIEPDKVRDFSAKIVWSEDGKSAEVPKEAFSMPVTQGQNWQYGDRAAKNPDYRVRVTRIESDGSAVPDNKGLAQLIKPYRGDNAVPLDNEVTGWRFTIGADDSDEIVHGISRLKRGTESRAANAVVLKNLPEVVKHAFPAESYRDIKASQGVKSADKTLRGMHRFYSPVVVDGKEFLVKITVKDRISDGGKGSKDRLAAYQITGIETEKAQPIVEPSVRGGDASAGGSPSEVLRSDDSSPNDPIASRYTEDEITVRDMLTGVKRDGDVVYKKETGADGKESWVKDEDKRSRFFVDEPNEWAYAEDGGYWRAPADTTSDMEFYQTTGAFSYDASSQPTDRLVAVHHIDADNLLKANALGGLAVPSIGITKVNSGYSGFGDITLIGTKGLIDPATGAQVYSADAYTNTFPAFEWGKPVDKKKAEALRQEYRKTERFFRGGMDNTMRSLIDSPDRDDFMLRFRTSVVSQKMFLDEKGIKVEPVYQQPYAGTPLEHLLLPLFQKIDADQPLDVTGSMQAYNEAYVQAVDALGDKATRVQKRNAGKIRNGGRLVDAYLYTLINNVEKIGKAPTEPQIDSYATEKRIREVFENNSEGFDAWVAKKTNGLFGEPRIKVGGKLVPVTLQNVVKAMTKRVAKNTQDTMTFGPGKVRAAASKKFSSVESIQANRERVVDPATADEANKSIDAAMSNFRSLAADFYGYKDTFAAMDDAMRALADSAKGKPTAEKVRAALVKNGFKEPKGGFPSELLDSGVKILTDVQKGLTDYFEAKPQRAVGLSEFAGAVVPEGTLPEVLKVLEDAGVEVRTYAKDTVLPGGERTNNRLQAEKELSQKLQQDRGDVLFQHDRGESEIRGSFNPQTNTIKLTPNANLSTFSHEHSHWYLTNLFAHAADKNLSPEARADIDALLKAFGLKSVEEYNALPFEKKVKLQEQYAAWTERYLAEGEVPAGYLQGMFRNFARWLMDMYRDLIGEGAGDDAAKKEIGERYKAQFGEDLPELSPDVRRVLNRMYDAEKKMASFRSNSKQVTAARVIQAQRTNNQKVTAPLQNGSAPDHFMVAIRAQQQAAQAMNSGEQVDVSQTMKNVPVNDATVRQAQNAFAKSFQMGDAGTIVVLQNRDRTGAVSVGQMNAIATAPDYTRLSVSRTTDSGAPIVSYGTAPDSQYLGNTETVADGSHKIPMTYAVVEADSVLRSNNFDGTPVPEYGTDPSRMHAIAGNGRMAGLSEAYNRGTAEQYRQDLMADAHSVGINPEVVAGMQRPVLVRIMPPEAVTTGFVERSNSSNVLEKSALETAVQDSPRIRNNVWKYQFDEDGAPTPETVRLFTIDIGEPNSLGKLLTADGRPTETATNRLRAAVFYEAYRDRTLTALVADDTDKQGIKRILNAMAAFAPHVINIREASNGSVDLGPILVDVVNRIRNAKIEGTPLESIVGQGDVFGDNPAVQQLLGFIAENQNSAAAIARVLEPFAAAVENRLKSSGNGPQGGLFGEAENVSTDLADVMGIFRDTQNRLIDEGNAAMREKGATEGFREALPAVDVAAMRNTLQAMQQAEKPTENVVKSVVETVAEDAGVASEPPPDIPPDAGLDAEAKAVSELEAHQAHELEGLSEENSERVQVEDLAALNPDFIYKFKDENGIEHQKTAAEILADEASIDKQADTDMAGLATAAMCIIRNNGIPA